MKKVLFTIFAALSVLLTACNKSEPASLSIAESNVDFTYEEGEGSVDFQTSSDIVSATSDSEWCRPTIRRTTVVVRVDANTGKDPRTAKLTIKNKEGLQLTVDVKQKGVRYLFESKDLEFVSAGGEENLEYYGPKMTIVIPDEAAQWLSAEISETNVKLVCAANDAVTTRTAKVGYAVSSKSGYITVSQAANDPYITFTPSMAEVNVKSDPSDNVYTYKTNSPTTPVVTVDKAFDWIAVTVTPDAKVAGTGTFKVHVDLNNSLKAREGSFQWSILKNASVKGTVAVKQAAADKVITHFDLVDQSGVAVKDLNCSAKGLEFNATVKTNAAGYTSTVDVDWITVTPAKFENPDYNEVSQAIKLTVAASTQGAARTGKVTLTIPDMDPVVVTVSQDKYIGVALTVKSITYDGAVTHMVPSDPNFLYIVETMEKKYFDEYESEQEIFEDEIASLAALGAQYGYTLEEIINLVAYQGEDDDDMTGYLDPETEYVVFAIPVSAKGELIGAITNTSYKTKEFPYNYLGEGTYTDDLVGPLYGFDNFTYPVDVYVEKANPNNYYMDTPYGPQFMSKITGETPEECEKYTGNFTPTMVKIQTSGSMAYMPLQAMGSKLSNTEGWLFAGCYSDYGVFNGTSITFPTKDSMVLSTNATTPMWYANRNGKTALLLPATKAAQPVLKARSAKTAENRHHYAKKPMKSFSSKDFHIMAVPFEK